jgi:hypothetical protein
MLRSAAQVLDVVVSAKREAARDSDATTGVRDCRVVIGKKGEEGRAGGLLAPGEGQAVPTPADELRDVEVRLPPGLSG